MGQPQALYVIGAGLLGAAATAVGEVAHDDNVRNIGIIAFAAAGLAFVAKSLLSWILDRGLKKWESIDAIPNLIDVLRKDIEAQFASMRTDVQLIGTNVAVHNASDLEWKKGADREHSELSRRLGVLEERQGWTVRAKDASAG